MIPFDQHPARLDFFGRKLHRKSYYTFLGTDSIQQLKAWRSVWSEIAGREPTDEDLVFLGKGGRPQNPGWLNTEMRRLARRLHSQGLIKNGSPASWHSHALRHSFESEASHAEVKAEIRDFFMGHLAGILWVYNHRAELHPEDLIQAYLKLEPHVSLDSNEIVLKEQYENREKLLTSELVELKRLYLELKGEILARRI